MKKLSLDCFGQLLPNCIMQWAGAATTAGLQAIDLVIPGSTQAALSVSALCTFLAISAKGKENADRVAELDRKALRLTRRYALDGKRGIGELQAQLAEIGYEIDVAQATLHDRLDRLDGLTKSSQAEFLKFVEDHASDFDSLSKFLEANHDAIVAALNEIKGKQDQTLAKLEDLNAKIAPIVDFMLAQVETAQQVAAALRSENEDLRQKLAAALARAAADTQAVGGDVDERLAQLRDDPDALVAFLDEEIERETFEHQRIAAEQAKRTARLVELHAERCAAAMAAVDYPAALVSAQAAAALAPDDGDAQNRLGFILDTQAQYAEALVAYREAERIDRAAFGDDHPNVAIRVNNIGSVLEAQGDLPGALAAYREAERIDRIAFGKDHPNVATAVNNIGLILKAQGDFAGALAKYSEAERIDRAAFGDNHPDVARDVNNIGCVLEAQSDLAGALAKFREAEQIDRAAFGDEHPMVAIRLSNIGGVLLAQGDLPDALAKLRQAEQINRAVFGDNHPNVAIDLSKIGGVLKAQGNLTGAMKMYREAERIDLAVFGDDHPKLAIRVSNIGSVLLAQGDKEGALAKSREAFGICLRKLGPRAQWTLMGGQNVRALGGDPVAEARALVGDAIADEFVRALAEADAAGG